MRVAQILESLGQTKLEDVSYGKRLVSMINQRYDPKECLVTKDMFAHTALEVIRAQPTELAIEIMEMNFPLRERADIPWGSIADRLHTHDSRGRHIRPFIVTSLTVATIWFMYKYAEAMLVVAKSQGTLPGSLEITAILAIPSAVLGYFIRMRSKDKQHRLDRAMGKVD